ncbi:hypothetical protein GCM10028821_39180 [Hymenobacter jeollabukensis]|uniref:site-specific DNA-methyltransferase (adenine-specific) n=1 Tax=Hymenobacter jeollabukensis TaxID=2025313 RepID=A0A5R8WL31_9BACT|nr:site-specific DNA-methyltransferase [Hymenobacter jeollabukensis]
MPAHPALAQIARYCDLLGPLRAVCPLSAGVSRAAFCPVPARSAPTPPPSADATAANRQQLRQLFPEAFRAGRLDVDVLRQLLGEAPADEEQEHYGLSWHGKRAARQQALQPPAAALHPAPADSLSWDSTRNLVVEGDNLDVLKLLRQQYEGQVKLIYIDPPYNTGKDFVYRDNYQRSRRRHRQLTGQPDTGPAVPADAAETAGRLHTDWLNLMYPRLHAARHLLRDDGVLFLSIDDNELENALQLLNELYGEENRLAIICHKARASVSNDKIISASHNFILLYAKDRARIHAQRAAFGLPPDLAGFTHYDVRGAYKLAPVDGPGGAAKGNPHYTFLGVTGYFRFAPERMQAMYEQGLIIKAGNGLQQKHYRHDAERVRKTDTTWWDDKYYTATATARLKALMGADVFDAPKPVELVERMLQLWARDPTDLVLDFFAGSGTTGHAVMSQNAQDGGTRRFILVQLPEPLDPANKDQCDAAAYCEQLGRPRTIAELTKERLRRAAAQLRAAHPDTPADLGFRVYRLAEGPAAAPKPRQRPAPVKKTTAPPATATLPELLEHLGLPLSTAVEQREVAGYALFALNGGAQLACLAPRLAPAELETLVGHLAAWHEELAPGPGTQLLVRAAACRSAEARRRLATCLEQAGFGAQQLRWL